MTSLLVNKKLARKLYGLSYIESQELYTIKQDVQVYSICSCDGGHGLPKPSSFFFRRGHVHVYFLLFLKVSYSLHYII